MKTLVLIICTVLFSSCLSLKGVSQFTTDEIRLGMEKTEFIKKFGQPYNKEMFYNDEHKPVERLFYKEQVYSKQWVTIITAFTFYESKLIEQEFVRERPMYSPQLETEVNNK